MPTPRTIEERLAWLEDRLSLHEESCEPAQPAKETETIGLPWQDVSTLWATDWEGEVIVWKPKENKWFWNKTVQSAFSSALNQHSPISHWCPITPPKSPTVEAPVEPEKEPVNLYGRWIYQSNDFWYIDPAHPKVVMSCHKKSTEKWGLNTLQLIMTFENFEIKVYATNPRAWLAWLAEQETKEAQADD